MSYNILHVAKWYPNKHDPQNGVFVQKHAIAASKHHNCAVIYFGIHDESRVRIEESKTENLREVKIYLPKFKVPGWSYLLKRRLFDKFSRSLFPGGVDLLHLHVLSNDQWLAVRWAARGKMPFVLTEHWSGFVNGAYDLLPQWQQKIREKIIAEANEVWPVSEFLKSHMEAKLPGKYKVVPNAVDLPKDLLPRMPKSFTWTVLADLVDDVKNISGVLKAFKIHLEKHPGDQLQIIGGGSDEKPLKNWAKNNLPKASFTFFGRKENREALSLLSRSSALVINSRFETFGVTGLEALALGKPVLSTHCGGPEEILATKGVVFHGADLPQALAKEMEAFKAKHSQLAKEINGGYLEGFSMDAVARQLNDGYHRVFTSIA